MLIALSLAFAVAANAQSPFAPPPKPAPQIVRLLAPSGALDGKTLRAFESESGIEIAYDAYGDPARIPTMMKDAAYDVVILPGPALAQAIAAGRLGPIEKAQIPNAGRIAAPVAAKLAAYDPSGGFGLAWGWSTTGILFNASETEPLIGRLPPSSWSFALNPIASGKLAPCGVALPDARDEMFIAAWRLLGIDPARVHEHEVKIAADLIIRARAAVRLPISPDPLSAIAGGAVCLTFGGAAQKDIASRRSREGGAGFNIQFASPREGGPIAIDALARPRDAPHPHEALVLIDYLLRPAVAAEATAAAGLTSAQDVPRTENFRALWPVGIYDPAVLPIVEKDWARARAPEKAAKADAKAKTKTKGKAEARPAGKKARTKR